MRYIIEQPINSGIFYSRSQIATSMLVLELGMEWLATISSKRIWSMHNLLAHMLYSASNTPTTLPESRNWTIVKDGHPAALQLFLRHYSRHLYKDGRQRNLFVGPGYRIVLLSRCQKALLVWKKFRSLDKQQGIYCSIFRNESNALSSDLLTQAEAIAWQFWPGERLYTYVNPRKIKSINPGFCFKMAGWSACGITKERKLLILEKKPSQPWLVFFEQLMGKSRIFDQPGTTIGMKLQVLESVIKKSWDSQTCFPLSRSKWTIGRPSVGQCAVTALLIQDELGGEILYNKNEDHFFNRLPDGQVIDLTIAQFNRTTPLPVDELMSRDWILNSDAAKKYKTLERYTLLKKRVRKSISEDLLLVEKIVESSR